MNDKELLFARLAMVTRWVALVISLAIAVLGVVMLVNGAGAGWVAAIGGLVMAAFYAITSRPDNRRGERPGGQFSHAGTSTGRSD